MKVWLLILFLLFSACKSKEKRESEERMKQLEAEQARLQAQYDHTVYKNAKILTLTVEYVKMGLSAERSRELAEQKFYVDSVENTMKPR